MIVWSDVTEIATELTGVSVGAQTTILAFVEEVLSPTKLGGEASARLKLARIYLCAHLASSTGAGGRGPVTMEMEGPVSRMYASSVTSGSLRETFYGRRYLEIIKGTPSRGPMVL